jgi:hypothetical protein
MGIDRFARAVPLGWWPAPFENVKAIWFAINVTRQDSMMIRRTSLQFRQFLWLRLLLLAGTILVSACSDSFEDHPPVYPVKGKVIVKGKPMSGGTIIFEYVGEGSDAPKGPPGGPFRATGKIDNEGTFNLSAYVGSEGMPAGDYKVGISARQGRSESNLFDRQSAPPKKVNTAVSGNQYADPKTSGLTAQVSNDKPNEPVFDLK